MGYRAWGEDRYTYPTSNALRYSCDNAPSSPLTPPARESIQRGRSSLWWGLETTPQLPFRFASRQGSGRTSGAGTGAQPCAPTEREPSAVRRESPERAQPSLVGAWGTPQPPFRSASRQGSGRTSGAGTGAQPCAPTGREPEAVRRESPERAQPSLERGWGYPPNPFPLCFPPGKRPDIWGGGRAHSRAPLRIRDRREGQGGEPEDWTPQHP